MDIDPIEFGISLSNINSLLFNVRINFFLSSGTGALTLQLPLDQLLVDSILLKKLRMRASLHNFAILHDRDHVRVLDGGETMGDADDGLLAGLD